MQWVDIIESDLTTMTATIAARASRMDDGSIVVEGSDTHQKNLRRAMRQPDSTDALEAIAIAYRTPYLYASDVQTGEPAAPVGTVAPLTLKKGE